MAHPLPPAEPVRVIDNRYEVVRPLGRGGFGEVYLVRDRRHRGAQLALKILRPATGNTEGFEERFQREIQILRTLSHAGIPRILNDGLTSDGQAFFTMEFVDGVTLASVLRSKSKRAGGLGPDRIIGIVRRVLEILDYAHRLGVVHRDLKPSNIMLAHEGTADEEVCVLDFGIAKVMSGSSVGVDMATLTVGSIGTPHYMAPEQLGGKHVDQRADIYALGVILYEMCSGRMPFEGDSDLEVASARLFQEPKPLPEGGTPPPIRRLVIELLAREPNERPRAQDVLDRLRPSSESPGTVPMELAGQRTTLTGIPKSWLSHDYQIWAGSTLLATLSTVWLAAWSGGPGHGRIMIDGRLWECGRQGLGSDTFILRQEEVIRGRATKPPLVRSFEVILDGVSYRWKAKSVFSRTFSLSEAGVVVGEMRAKNAFTRHANIDLPDSLSLECRAFLVWLAMLTRRRP